MVEQHSSDRSSLIIHVDAVDVLVPLPKPRFGSSSLDSMVASVANNLLSQENVAFMSFHCGGDVYETICKQVGLKQQRIVFGSDIIIPVIEENIVTKVALNNDSCTTSLGEEPHCFLPISIRLNRKGLIDSEVVAVGKLLIPQSIDSTVSPSSKSGVVNYSVPLINSDENLEIAVARVSVKSNRSNSSSIGRVLSEMEMLLAQYTKSNEEKIALTDSIERFLGCITPVRRFVALLVSALTWEPSWVKSWLFMIIIWFHPLGLPVYLIVIALIATNSPLPFLGYLKVNMYDIRSNINYEEDIIAENLAFLSNVVNSLATFSQMLIRQRMKSELIMAVIVMLFLCPLSWNLVAFMVYQTFVVQAIISWFLKRGKGNFYTTDSPILTSSKDSGQYIVYENQRWWLGKWSDRLINDEAQPWTTAIGPSINAPEFAPKESFILPKSEDPAYQWKWNGPWSEEEWMYAQDFRHPKMHAKRELTDFVRQRRWTRKFTRVKT